MSTAATIPKALLRTPVAVDRKRPARTEASVVMRNAPFIGAHALFIRHVVHDEGAPHQVAATDSDTVWTWPAFYLNYTAPERAGILLHEYLHVAYAHPQRGAILQQRLGREYVDGAFGMATDMLVNGAIRTTFARSKAWICLPEDAILAEQQIEAGRAIQRLTGIDLKTSRLEKTSKLSVETIYAILIEFRNAARKLPPQTSDSEDAEGALEKRRKDAQARDDRRTVERFLRNLTAPSDVVTSGLARRSLTDLQRSISDAGDKLRAAVEMHGDVAGSMIEALSGDVPQSTTAWETRFRSIVQRHATRGRDVDRRMPGGRVLSLHAMGRQNIIWSPARKAAMRPHIWTGLDSSGSTDQEMFLRFKAELMGMRRRTGVTMTVVVADVAIQQIIEIRKDEDVPDVQFKGRGGTDFRDVIAKAEEAGASLLVYLTDLEGTFPGRPPNIPVLWAVPKSCGKTAADIPFGTFIEID